ncbi:hypothetical protein M1N61_01470 [Peptococcaceae bacterium]|nr:hypothetical protein [Peptococcaceae bacterium]
MEWKKFFNAHIWGRQEDLKEHFFFFEEIEEYKGLSTSFYYFGDLDAEGISIWYELTEQREVVPFVYFYCCLFERNEKKHRLSKRSKFLKKKRLMRF